jgi:hypothetical protein
LAANSPRETFAGRYYFLKSVEKVNREVLESLSQDVRPHLVKRLIPRLEAMARGIERSTRSSTPAQQIATIVVHWLPQQDYEMINRINRRVRYESLETLASISPSAAGWMADHQRYLADRSAGRKVTKARLDANPFAKLMLLNYKFSGLGIQSIVDAGTEEALLKWKTRFNLRELNHRDDPWITEAAVETLIEYAGRPCDGWYIPKAEAAARVSSFLRKNAADLSKIRRPGGSEVGEIRSAVRSLIDELQALDRRLEKLSDYDLDENDENALPPPDEAAWNYAALAMYQTQLLSPEMIRERLETDLRITKTKEAIGMDCPRKARKIGLEPRHGIRGRRTRESVM